MKNFLNRIKKWLTPTEITTIDLTNYQKQKHIFVGKEYGKNIRQTVKFGEKNRIIIPINTYSINPSFWIGLLGEEIKSCKSQERFFDKFQIEGWDYNYLPSLLEALNRILIKKKLKE